MKKHFEDLTKREDEFEKKRCEALDWRWANFQSSLTTQYDGFLRDEKKWSANYSAERLARMEKSANLYCTRMQQRLAIEQRAETMKIMWTRICAEDQDGDSAHSIKRAECYEMLKDGMVEKLRKSKERQQALESELAERQEQDSGLESLRDLCRVAEEKREREKAELNEKHEREKAELNKKWNTKFNEIRSMQIDRKLKEMRLDEEFEKSRKRRHVEYESL